MSSEWNFAPEVIVKAQEIGIGARVVAHWTEAECPDQEGTVVGVEIHRYGKVEYTVHLDGDISPTDGFTHDPTGQKPGTISIRSGGEEKNGVGEDERYEEARQDGWNVFEGDFLTDGNGYAPAATYAACRAAYNSTWNGNNTMEATRAAVAEFRRLHPSIAIPSLANTSALVSLRAENERLRKDRDAAVALAERFKLEAQGHASEARTANTTIYEIYQVLSGSSGEPGNWHGAEPARAFVAATKAKLEEAAKVMEPFVNVRDQHPESVKLINGKLDGFTLMSVNVTKDQFIAAHTFLSNLKGAE